MNEAEQRRYHAIGRDYFWLAGKRALVTDLLRAQGIPPGGGRRILDLGCGPGHDVPDLAAFGNVVGLDATWEALRLCRCALGDPTPLVCADALRLPFGEGVFDGAVLLDVLEHLDQDVAALEGIRRVLHPEGWMVISVPAFRWLWGEHDTLYGHRRRYTRPELRRALAAAGFRVVHDTYVHGAFIAPLFVMRSLKRLLPRSRRPDDFVPVPPWLNRALTACIAAERLWTSRRSWPFGVSLLCLARPR